MCDLEDIGSPSIFKLIRKAGALDRILSTLVLIFLSTSPIFDNMIIFLFSPIIKFEEIEVSHTLDGP